jgi:16S rRNA G966 N2-methylase RsmD
MVKDNEINISPEEWLRLNECFSKDEIKKMISDAIGDNNLPMPMREISESESISDFDKLLSLDDKEIIKEEEWFTRYEYSDKYPLSNTLFSTCNIGNKTSDYHQQENRWRCDSINSPSPYRTWTTEKFRMTLLNALWSLKLEQVNSKNLRACIALRKYIASQFRPSAAKAIYNYFGAQKVLDFSSGWGDRLCGFLASDAESYMGIDPNEKLFSGYEEMYDSIAEEKEVEIINCCAEDADLPEETFDLVFTSPPYFNIERYTQENNQSWKKYRKIEVWLENFLFVALQKSWNSLINGGYLVINISDVYSNHTINKICDPMNDFISELKNAKYTGCYGYQMRKRPSSGALKGKKGKFAEPIWIWQKTK